MKKLLIIPLFFFSISVFGQFTKNQLYNGINLNIRNKGASQKRLADMLDSIVVSMGSGGGSMVYPGSGIPLSTGSAWGTSITDNSSNWNTAFGWGDHATAGYLTALTNGNGTTVNGTGDGVDLGGTMASDATITGAGNKLRFTDGTFALRNVANTYDAIFSNTNTANRTYTLPNASGTIALTSDLSGYIAKTGTTTITGNVLINGGFNFSIGSSGTRPTAIDLYTSGDLTEVATGNIASLSTGGSVTNRYYNGGSNESITNVNSSGVTIANTITGNVSSIASTTIADGNIQGNTFYTDGTTIFSTRSNHYYDSLYFESSKSDGIDDSLSSITLTHRGIKIRTFTDSPSIGDVLTITGSDGSAKFQAPSGGGGGLTVGTSTITSGTNTKVLYNNSGVLGEYTVSGTGNVALTTSPTFTTPALGTPSALVGTNITGTATGLTSGITNALKSATTTVDVSAATAPTSGQVLTATGGTAATWQTPASASGAWLLTGTSTLTGASTIVGTSSNTNTFQYASLATSTTPVFTLENPTAAAAGAQQFSPFFRQRARGWKTNATAASQTVDFDFGVTPVQGAAAPTGYWSLWSSINGGTQSENVRFRSDGSIFLTGGTGFSANLYFGTSGDAYIGRSVSGTQGISVYGALTTANIYTLNMSPSLSYSYTSGTGGMLALAGNFTAASGAGNFYGSNSTGTINMTGTSSGNVFGYGVNQTVTAAKGDYTGFYHNPTITSVTGVHYSFRAASGKVLFGGTSITSNTFYDFRGGSSTDNILRLANGSNNELFTFKANKEYEVTQTNAKYQERHSTGTTAATTFSEVIYSSTDISDGQSVTIEVLWAAKDSGANTGAGGIFYTTWTKASGTLAKAGDNQSVTNDNMTGSWAISTSDSSGSIQLDFVGTGVANSEISFSTRIIKTN